MATYLFGSKSREHERDVLACPTMRWLGIHSNDLEFYEVFSMSGCFSSTNLDSPCLSGPTVAQNRNDGERPGAGAKDA